jgi:hypothetical protein
MWYLPKQEWDVHWMLRVLKMKHIDIVLFAWQVDYEF